MPPRRQPPSIPLDQPLTREIRAAMVDSGLTSYALATLSGLDESAVRRFMSRERDSIMLSTADKLCVALRLKLVRQGRPKPPAVVRAAGPAYRMSDVIGASIDVVDEAYRDAG